MHKAKEISHLLFGNGLSCNRVINHNPGKLKLEWILHKDVIVNRHLECRAKNPSHRFDGAMPLSMVEQNDNSFDGIINNVPAAPVPDFAEINEKADQEDIIADTKASVMEKIKEQQEKVKLAPIPEPEKKTPVICPCREM